MLELPTHLIPVLPTMPALHELIALPVAVFVVLALLLWSGRIRQKVLVNVLALGIMLPMMQLSMVAMGAHWLSQELQPTLMGMLPAWAV